MKTIWKYKLDVLDYQVVEIPRLEQIQVLSVSEQRGDIVMYAIVDDEIPKGYFKLKNVGVRILGTGHPITVKDEYASIDDMRFVGTVKLMNGTLMFHVFVKE